jgi:hypothetical protein
MNLSLKLKSAAAGVALAISAATLTPAAAFEFSSYHRIGVHDYWYSFSVKLDGAPATGAATDLGKDASAALLFTTQHAAMLLDNGQWGLQPNSKTHARVSLDGVAFDASAIILSRKQVLFGAEDPKFVRHLLNAREAVVEVNGDRWTLNLQGMREAVADALSVIKNVSE